MSEPDAFLRRFERTSLVACLVGAAGGVVVSGGDWWVGVAVVGGGALAAISYAGVKAGVEAAAGGQRAWSLVKFFTRYGILALCAYVMLARLRLHPVGVVAGASSPVVAAMVAAARVLRSGSRSEHQHETDVR
jgi:hypothetical protein